MGFFFFFLVGARMWTLIMLFLDVFFRDEVYLDCWQEIL